MQHHEKMNGAMHSPPYAVSEIFLLGTHEARITRLEEDVAQLKHRPRTVIIRWRDLVPGLTGSLIFLIAWAINKLPLLDAIRIARGGG